MLEGSVFYVQGLLGWVKCTDWLLPGQEAVKPDIQMHLQFDRLQA